MNQPLEITQSEQRYAESAPSGLTGKSHEAHAHSTLAQDATKAGTGTTQHSSYTAANTVTESKDKHVGGFAEPKNLTNVQSGDHLTMSARISPNSSLENDGLRQNFTNQHEETSQYDSIRGLSKENSAIRFFATTSYCGPLF
jgi:hypothetical protein